MIAVYNLTGSSIVRSTRNYTSTVVIGFFQEDVSTQFGPLEGWSPTMRNALLLQLHIFLLDQGINSHTLLYYPPIRNDKAEWMVGKMKQSLEKIYLNGIAYFEDSLRTTVYGYRMQDWRRQTSHY